jgi:hypothetical protein
MFTGCCGYIYKLFLFQTGLPVVFILNRFTGYLYVWTSLLVFILDMFTGCYYFRHIYQLFLFWTCLTLVFIFLVHVLVDNGHAHR